MQSFFCDVKHFRVVEPVIVKHVLDDYLKREGGDVQHVEQYGFAGSHFVSVLNSCTSLRISVVPLEILVVMPKAWKKEVFLGPRTVFWTGTVTSHKIMAPAQP